MKSKWITLVLLGLIALSGRAQYPETENEMDRKIKTFLQANSGNWHDWNIPASDGRILYDLIVENGYQSAVEIGTSTGHSTIWIAWALSKTGGKLTTIEVDEKRYREAVENFKKAGVAQYIDARLGDAHEMVPELPGRYDFVFSDADKYWYTNYFKAMDPKLEVGGCFTAHNTSMRASGINDFLRFVKSLDNYETIFAKNSRAGISISFKRAEKP